MKIGVIGAGWYGCHIANTLKNLGCEVIVFERHKELFEGASGNNQNRLHQGFHYARNYRTRVQSRDGYQRFLDRYPNLSSNVKNNIYAVPEKKSLLDFITYKSIMITSGIEFQEVSPKKYGIENCIGAIKTEERVLNLENARCYFKESLKDNLRYQTEVKKVCFKKNKYFIGNEEFNFLIDCTWGAFSEIDANIFFEPTLLLYYESANEGLGLTFVDGDLCSIYPTDRPNIFTLSSVRNTPLGRYESFVEAHERMKCVCKDELLRKKTLFEEEISFFYPNFTKEYKYAGNQLSLKTKIMGENDDRSCYVQNNDGFIKVLSGKIDTIFYASEEIVNIISTKEI